MLVNLNIPRFVCLPVFLKLKPVNSIDGNTEWNRPSVTLGPIVCIIKGSTEYNGEVESKTWSKVVKGKVSRLCGSIYLFDGNFGKIRCEFGVNSVELI